MSWMHRRHSYGTEANSCSLPPHAAALVAPPSMGAPASRSPLAAAAVVHPNAASGSSFSPQSSQQSCTQSCEAPLQPGEGAAPAAADEVQLQSMLSALRVALSKKEAALVSIAGQLAEAESRLQGYEAEKFQLESQLRELQATAGAVTPGRLASASALTHEGRLLAQARQEIASEAAKASKLAAERNALQQDVSILQQQLTAAAQAEAKERERLCNETTQSRLLARARARQVEQLQAQLQQVSCANNSVNQAAMQRLQAAQREADIARAAATEAGNKLASAQAQLVELQQQLKTAQASAEQAVNRAGKSEQEVEDLKHQMDWQALRIQELEQTSGMGQVLQKYQAEMQRLRAELDAERCSLQAQLAQAQQFTTTHQQTLTLQQATMLRTMPAQPAQADHSWATLFDSDEPKLTDSVSQTDQENSGKQQEQRADGEREALNNTSLMAEAQKELQRLQDVNAKLLTLQEDAQQALQQALEKERLAAADLEHERSAKRSIEAQLAVSLEAAARAEAAMRDSLSITERQLEHQAGEVAALREANEKLELALAAMQESKAGQVPLVEVQQLQQKLRSALGHTRALETQVVQLKQQAASLAQQHEAELQCQKEQGGKEATSRVSAALDAVHHRHALQVQDLQGRLLVANRQLQEANSQLSMRQKEALLRKHSLVEAGVQARPVLTGQAASVQVCMQLDMSDAAAQTGPIATEPATAAALALDIPGPMPSRACSTCEERISHADGMGMQCSPVLATAKQLQLELARVKIAPFKPLPSAFGLQPGSLARTVLARRDSASGGLGCPGTSCDNSRVVGPGLPYNRSNEPAGAYRSRPAESMPILDSGADVGPRWEEEEGFATPMAGTPGSLSPNENLLGPQAGGTGTPSSPALSSAAFKWEAQPMGRSAGRGVALCGTPFLPTSPGQQQLHGVGQHVPPLNVQLVRPYSSLSCTSSMVEEQQRQQDVQQDCNGSMSIGGSCAVGSHAAASDSVSSLASSLGPSASQLEGWVSRSAGLLNELGSQPSNPSPLPQDCIDGVSATSSIYNFDVRTSDAGATSWQTASLDASLARLAALTAGLQRQK